MPNDLLCRNDLTRNRPFLSPNNPLYRFRAQVLTYFILRGDHFPGRLLWLKQHKFFASPLLISSRKLQMVALCNPPESVIGSRDLTLRCIERAVSCYTTKWAGIKCGICFQHSQKLIAFIKIEQIAPLKEIKSCLEQFMKRGLKLIGELLHYVPELR